MDPYYCLIVGSRDFSNYAFMTQKTDQELGANKSRTIVISGGARGADALAKRYANDNGLSYIEFPANWNLFGNRAGYIRNEEMHRYIADHSSIENRKVIAFWDGSSKGTAHSIKLAKEYNNPITIIKTNPYTSAWF